MGGRCYKWSVKGGKAPRCSKTEREAKHFATYIIIILDKDFVFERQQGLQTVLEYIGFISCLHQSIYFRQFIDPSNYSINFQGKFL